ncbi:MAG: hypothetical protein WC492_04200 [Candidatus Micrarchaeia archaeon]
MMNLDQIINGTRETINSGYYERLAPARTERKSLCEYIEKAQEEGILPVVAGVATAMPDIGLLLANRKVAGRLIEKLCVEHDISAIDVWVEPRHHAGDLRWLAKELPIPIISRDWVIDSKQIVGGDAILLNLELMNAAQSDPHELIEVAHDLDCEVVLEVRNEEEFCEAKRSEADVIMINNRTDTGADISITIKALTRNKTGRPVISAHGINNAQDVRSLIVAGVNAVEMSEVHVCNGHFEQRLGVLKNAIYGKDPKMKIEEENRFIVK